MPARLRPSRTLAALTTSLACIAMATTGTAAVAQAATAKHNARTANAKAKAKASCKPHKKHAKCTVRGKVGAARTHRPATATKHLPQTVTVALTPVAPAKSPPAPAAASVALPAPSSSGSSACSQGDVTPDPTNIAVVEAATICLVNQVRAQHGLAPLTVDPRLQASAQQHNDDMVNQDYFEHVGPDGDSPLSRMQAAGYADNSSIGYLVGENIAWGTLTLATPAAIVDAWVHSPDHLANILERTYTVTGLAVAPEVPESFADGQAGAIYTQDFGGVSNAG